MKKILLTAMILLSLTCAGCFQSKFDLTITDDGAVIRNWKIIGTAAFSRQIEQMKENNERLIPNLRVKPISEGDMLGYEFTADYPDIESFAKSHSDFYAAHEGKNRGVSQHKGWFFDTYDFNFYCNVPRGYLPPEADYVTQATLQSMVYDLTIHLPYAAEKHDADEISADKKILRWNLSAVVMKGGERFMNVRFKIRHVEKILLTAAVELIFIAAGIFFFVKARSEESPDLGKDLRFKRNVFAGLSVVLAIVAACMIFAPVAFTDADIISVAVP